MLGERQVVDLDVERLGVKIYMQRLDECRSIIWLVTDNLGAQSQTTQSPKIC